MPFVLAKPYMLLSDPPRPHNMPLKLTRSQLTTERSYQTQPIVCKLQDNKTSQKVQFSSVHSLSRVRLFATPWTAAHQASLSITNSWSLLKLMSIESEMPSNNLILCRPLLLPPSIFSSIRVFSNESAHCIRWPKY